MTPSTAPVKYDYKCMHEKRLNKNENRITELEARADFKDQRITLIDEKLDKINDSLNELKLQSTKDDNDIDNRVTALESHQKTINNVLIIVISVFSTIIAFLSFIITIIH